MRKFFFKLCISVNCALVQLYKYNVKGFTLLLSPRATLSFESYFLVNWMKAVAVLYLGLTANDFW